MRALETDLYQLTMAAGFFACGKSGDRATFELFVRRLPERRDMLVFAGLEQAVEYLLELRFEGREIDYLRNLSQFGGAPPAFWDYLREFRFTGDLFAMPEGTPFFAGEPVLTLRAPLIEAQIPETFLLATVGFQTMIASKAARVVDAARGRSVVEFGTRRAHSPHAGVLAGRAAYLAGCAGTSNVESGIRFGVPVFGTAAHSWVMAFENESASFAALQRILGPMCTYLVDTYDSLEGTRQAIALGRPLWGIRLDSGDLASVSRECRRLLDDAGLKEARIMASGDLNEDKVRSLVEAGAPIDAFGVGTELSTSADAPNLSAVYKMVEIEPAEGGRRYTSKTSPDKKTIPGAKQVFRFAHRDVVGWANECGGESTALLRPVIIGGRLVEPLPAVQQVREYCSAARKTVTANWPVEYSATLEQLSAGGSGPS